ncbi:enoyl-CoA hydratase-related protein [Actinophytocola oryzae]|uniref:Short chain enoyl-CoA hydratase n=1 Tax=Actinophytocola oryzae TaxID=502181 RepID=A0A4R7W742_9PSEU|nr:enoyl-CoA hydratase-related protein [Actinophytocola oryzae]TDV57537.1 short chain enoyl-CoA hydratase [Actinophytocola oryzae]
MGNVTVDRSDVVGIVTLDSPENRNALSTDVLVELADALESLDADPDVRAAVLTGGPSLFASGADVRLLRSISPVEYAASARATSWRRIGGVETVLVAAVAGYALGGGCELALAADLVVAADTAVFGQPEVRLGLVPGAGGTQRWARAAGRYAAAGIVLTGRDVDAFEARSLGLVHRIVPAERLVPAAVAVAASVAANGPLAVRAARGALRRAEELPLSAALDHERAQLLAMLATEDHVEGIDALLEKRFPRFTGR